MGNRRFWKTKDGRKIRIKDMDDQHLLNSILLLEHKAESEVRKLPFPMFQGEMAQFCAEQAFDSLMEDPHSLLNGTIYEDLCDEARRRKLEWMS